MRNRAGSGLFVLGALALTLGGLQAPEHAVRDVAATTTFTVSPNPAIAGESVRMSGKLASAVARPVVLQRLSGGSWVKVTSARTTSTGRFAFARSAPSSATTYRVVAPRARVNGRSYAPITTPRRGLSIATQKVVLAMDTSLTAGESTLVTVTATPARSGRYVDFQEPEGDGWTTFDTSRTDSSGIARTRLGWDGVGTYTIRAFLRAANGAPARASAPVTIIVGAPELPRLYRYTRSSTGGDLAVGGGPVQMTADGRRILWLTGSDGIRIWDRDTRAVTTVNRPTSLANLPLEAASRDLRRLVFTRAYDGARNEMYVWDRSTGTITSLSRTAQGEYAEGSYSSPSLSDDGRYVAFASTANELPTTDPNPAPNAEDAFLADLESGALTPISGPRYDPVWQEGARVSLSGDGSTAMYLTSWGNVVPGKDHTPVHALWRRATGSRQVVAVGDRVYARYPNMAAEPLSTDGGKALVMVATPQGGDSVTAVVDTVGGGAVVLPEVASPTGDSTTLPLYADGISGDGTTVTGNVSDLRFPGPVEVGDVYWWRVGQGTPTKVTKRASDGDWSRGVAGGGSLSGDGRWLTFASNAEDLIAGDSDNNGVADGFLWDSAG